MEHILKCHPILKSDFVSAQGCTLVDRRGHTYLDCESGVWCTALGHNHPRVSQVLANQSATLSHLGFRYGCDVVEEAAIDLLKILDFPDGKVVFLTSGSEAVELSMKLAQIATGRNRWIGLEPSYLAAYGLGCNVGTDRWLLLDRADTVPQRAFDTLQIAALVFEPGSAGGSVHFPAPSLIEPVAHDLQHGGGLVVVDDVTTGMGRTGKWFGFQHYNIKPDIVAVGKGLGNGYPVSAVAVRQRVADTIEAAGLHYVQSHQNDPLGCAVVREVIAVMEDEELIARSQQLGDTLLNQLQQLDNTAIKAVRGKGLMIAIELVETVQAGDVFEHMLKRGCLLGCNPSYNCIRLMPPLTITEKQVEHLMEQLMIVLRS